MTQGNASTKILLVDDDLDKVSALRTYLEGEHYQVEAIADGQSALDALFQINPDIILLDVHMPRLNGIDTCRIIRSYPQFKHGTTGIIMFSDKRIDMVDRVSGLDMGADRYLVRPVAPRELLSEVKALERIIMANRKDAGLKQPDCLVLDKRVTIDFEERVVVIEGEKKMVQPLLFSILEFLAKPPNRARSKHDVIWECWSNSEVYDSKIDENALTTAVSRLRQVLEEDPRQPRYLKTVHGYGYKLIAAG